MKASPTRIFKEPFYMASRVLRALAFTGFDPKVHPASHPLLDPVNRRAGDRSVISEHLPDLFAEALVAQPKLIVELGVRAGESTAALSGVASLTGATLVSVDIADCAGACDYANWHFVREDDVAFAARFPAFCRERGLPPAVDVLFIDTSHLYDHTREEIRAWFPLLAPRCKVLFHDTNLRLLNFYKDGSFCRAWDCGRGVIRAIEGLLGKRFDERHDFVDLCGEWVVRHRANCCGFTILDRIPPPPAPAP